MIVDDEAANVEIVRHHLLQAGYVNFVTTTDSRSAMNLAIEKSPDLILLDIKMPHVNGLELMQGYSANSRTCNVPVVILTSATDPKIKRMALDLGASDFLTKPVDANDLVPRVRNALMIKYHFDQLADQKSKLETLAKSRMEEL